MNLSEILHAIDEQIAKLQQAREMISVAASAPGGSTPKKRRGRPPGSGTSAGVKPVPKRIVSEAGKARIAAAQKKRWAESRKVSKAS